MKKIVEALSNVLRLSKFAPKSILFFVFKQLFKFILNKILKTKTKGGKYI